MQLLCHLLFLVRSQVGAQRQCMRVGAHGKLLDLGQKRLQCGRLCGKFLVIPRRGGVGRQAQHIRLVHAGIRAGPIDVGGEIENLRKQDHAVQVGVVFVFQ